MTDLTLAVASGHIISSAHSPDTIAFQHIMYIYSGLFYTNLLNVFKSDQVFDTNKVVKIEISDRDMLNTDLDVEELLNHWATRQERELSSDEGGMFFYNHNMLHSTLQSQ